MYIIIDTPFMKQKLFYLALFIFISSTYLMTSCGEKEKHFISDAAYRSQVEQAFEEKKKAFTDESLFSIFDDSLSVLEREALTFMYAYMPIGDVTDYTGDYYLKNIRSSFEAQVEMPWGKNIPEVIFRHFVLPVRVNNENMDDSRWIFFDELKDRVKGLSLADAVLEVNHWCHEKVIYTPSDGRTSSPLASVKTAYGRCGEESTFTVAALRSVGIPARQVYTPRWAHTDNNHAWVEAWVDGEWYFLGACEPEPVLNMAWFNAPAYRGMLMHTKVFGAYNGPEEIMEETDCYTEINVIDNYAPTARIDVVVVDADNNPVSDAVVEYQLYNHAEFNSVARKTTDSEGKSFLTAGKGDMLIWASKDGNFGFHQASFGKDTELTVVLDKKPGDITTLTFDIVPPVAGEIPVEVTDEQKEENARRLLEEDKIREAYVSTFYTEDKAKALASELGVDAARTTRYMLGSRGNWATIEKFLRDTPKEKRSMAMDLLSVISAKDLRDIPYEVLFDHISNTAQVNSPLFARYILNPRVANEFLTPYKSYFQNKFDAGLAATVKENPMELVKWVKENIQVNDALNPLQIPVMPTGVWRGRVADAGSRDIFFVSLARSMGIPAQIEPVARKVQYAKDGKWMDVDFDALEETIPAQGYLTALYEPTKVLPNPAYFTHFSVAALKDNGQLQTLNLRSNKSVDMGGGDTWSGLLKTPLVMDEGHYAMVTGTRMASGKVLATLSFFDVKAGETTQIPLTMREDKEDIQVIGNIDAEAMFTLADGSGESSILNTTGRGYFVIGILGPRQEPTNHAMRDISPLKKEFEAWGRSMILLFKDEQAYSSFDVNEFGELPSTITYGIDKNDTITKMIVEATNLSNQTTLPIFIVADTFGRVVFVSQGYTIGMGDQLMSTINRL